MEPPQAMSSRQLEIFRKHDSVAEMRHHAPPPEDVLPRVAQVPARLGETELSEEAQALVRQACEELLGTSTPSGGDPPFLLQSYVVEEISRLTDEELPRYLWYRYRYDTFPQRKILDTFPPCLQVEPASACNYRCVFCFQTDPVLTKRTNGHMGTMSLALFKEIIGQAAGSCEAVTLASRGEPLLCPDIEAMLAYAGGKFLALKLNTNASLLDERKCHAILAAGVNTVVFSVDAAAEPAYSRLRVGGKLDLVLQNIRRFGEIRAKHYPRSRTITRVAGVKFDGASEMDEMERAWGDLVDQVAFVTYNPWENTYERPINDLATPCSDLWRRMFVWWNGVVNPCDVDYRSMLAVGDAAHDPLRDLWRGTRYTALRAAHLERQRSATSPCNRCTVV